MSSFPNVHDQIFRYPPERQKSAISQYRAQAKCGTPRDTLMNYFNENNSLKTMDVDTFFKKGNKTK